MTVTFAAFTYSNVNDDTRLAGQDQAKNLTEQIVSLRDEVATAKQRHQVELWEKDEKFKVGKQRILQARNVAHQEEVSALTDEWNRERKVHTRKSNDSTALLSKPCRT